MRNLLTDKVVAPDPPQRTPREEALYQRYCELWDLASDMRDRYTELERLTNEFLKAFGAIHLDYPDGSEAMMAAHDVRVYLGHAVHEVAGGGVWEVAKNDNFLNKSRDERRLKELTPE